MTIKLTDQDKIQITSPEDIYEIMQRILLREDRIDREKEHFWIVGMNVAGIILYIELVSMGGARYTVIEPMNVFRVAVLKNATRVIAIHNHPSGVLKASEQDLDITDRLIQVGRILDINLDDHLIINPQTFVSFKAIGMMDKLSLSLKYVPPYLIPERLKEQEEAAKKAVNDAVLDDRKKIVISMLKNGLTEDQISKVFNLTCEEIEQIQK